MARIKEVYGGFEQGPIRPPSEAHSLLIRITRNCPWNRCRFCYIYNDTKFSIRSVDHVKRDIDMVYKFVEALSISSDSAGRIDRDGVSRVAETVLSDEIEAFNAAVNWMALGSRSVFLQDANSPVMRPSYLIEILTHIKYRFPWVDRITSYARSHTLARISPDDMMEIASSGLNRIHVGLETGSDKLLALINKGSTKSQHIEAGQKVKNAGIELSEYIMPGLGGTELSDIHASETADALNQIDPHYIRLRTLLIPPDYQLFEESSSVRFHKLSDIKIVEEIKRFVDGLEGITSELASDHNNNLLPAVQGKFPGDKSYLIDTLNKFLDLAPKEKLYFQVGRRFGFMVQTSDLWIEDRLEKAKQICQHHGITFDNADEVIDRLARRSL